MANRLIGLCQWQALVGTYGYSLVPCDFRYEKYFVGTRKHRISRHLLLPTLARTVEHIEIPVDKEGEAEARITEVLESGRRATIGLRDWLPHALRNRPFDEAKARRHFAPVRRFHREAQATCDLARQTATSPAPKTSLLVGVHIRHDDFVNHDGGRWFVGLETVVANMRHFGEIAGETQFLVCSDAHFTPADFPGLRVTMGPGHPVSDLTALALCDYILKPAYSTFAQWSAWWNQTPHLYFQAEPHFALSDFWVPTLEPCLI